MAGPSGGARREVVRSPVRPRPGDPLSPDCLCDDMAAATGPARPGPAAMTSYGPVAPTHLGGPPFGVFPLMR